jgi:XapX domain-containing protein
MVSGLLLKWVLVVGVLYLALARLGLPAPPLLAGIVATMIAPFLTQGFQSKGLQ